VLSRSGVWQVRLCPYDLHFAHALANAIQNGCRGRVIASAAPCGVLTHGPLELFRYERRHRERGDTLPLRPQAIEARLRYRRQIPGLTSRTNWVASAIAKIMNSMSVGRRSGCSIKGHQARPGVWR
jgi:hypothetical protein